MATDCGLPCKQLADLNLTQRVHVGIWYILRAKRGSHIPTLRPKYLPYSYMDPLGHLLAPCESERRLRVHGVRLEYGEPQTASLP